MRTIRFLIEPGQVYQGLTVIEKVGLGKDNKPLWKAQCHRCEGFCIVPTKRVKKNKSCGCLRREKTGPMKPEHVMKLRDARSSIKPGNVYGLLSAIERSPKLERGNKNVVYWRCRCECGGIVDVPNKKLIGASTSRRGKSHNLHCGHKRHGGNNLRYPPTPIPYPQEAGAIASKHLHMLKRFNFHMHRDAYDIAADRFYRACFIVYWRSRYGTSVGDEKRYIAKSIRYSAITARQNKAAELRGGVLYNLDGRKIIGGVMSNSTMTVEAISETLPGFMLPTCEPRKVKRFKRR